MNRRSGVLKQAHNTGQGSMAVPRDGAVLDGCQIMSNASRTGTTAEEWGRTSRNISHMLKNSLKLRVLVVDDEPLIRWSLCETLEESDLNPAGDH